MHPQHVGPLCLQSICECPDPVSSGEPLVTHTNSPEGRCNCGPCGFRRDRSPRARPPSLQQKQPRRQCPHQSFLPPMSCQCFGAAKALTWPGAGQQALALALLVGVPTGQSLVPCGAGHGLWEPQLPLGSNGEHKVLSSPACPESEELRYTARGAGIWPRVMALSAVPGIQITAGGPAHSLPLSCSYF